jgi:hypothetical protein
MGHMAHDSRELVPYTIDRLMKIYSVATAFYGLPCFFIESGKAIIMVRNLYRFYLYTVFIALLIFTAVVTGQLLDTLFTHTPLLGSYRSVSSQAEIVQALVFVAVTWLIAGALGALHYWLIRRDIQSNPAAGNSAIRSFFLNIAEAVGIAIAVPLIGFLVFGNLASYPGGDSASPLASALVAFALVAFLEWERRRTEVRSGTALAFQRIHFYGVQVLLLIYLSFACFEVIRPLVDGLIFGGNVALEQCRSYGASDCSSANVFFLVISLLWFVAFWIGYGWLIKDDNARLFRLILHGISFACGVGFVLTGIVIAVQVIIAPLFNLAVSLKDVLGSPALYDFISPLVLGLLAAGMYHLLLRKAAQQALIDRAVLSLMECAIIVILAAAIFWWGCGFLLYNLFQTLMPVPAAPDAKLWVFAVACIVVGAGYIPLDIYLHRRNVLDPAVGSGPRRGTVLALLGGGILALAIGGAIALYAWMTALFGSAISNWQQVAHSGLAAFIVGVCLVGIYLWFALKERLLGSRDKQPTTDITPSVPSDASLTTIEAVLDELLAGKITRDEAATRIHALNNSAVSVTDQV